MFLHTDTLSTPGRTAGPGSMREEGHWLALAQQRGLQRTLAALLREALLPRASLVRAQGSVWLPLERGRWLELVLAHADAACDDLWQPPIALRCHEAGAQSRLIRTGSELLRLVMTDAMEASALERTVQELDNSAANDARAMAWRDAWGQRLQSTYAGAGNFLQVLRDEPRAQALLLLEQWGAQGHPTHPTHKAKLGMDEAEVAAYSPEFGARVQLVLAALRREHATVTLGQGVEDYPAWFGTQWPQLAAGWHRGLRARGLSADDWLPLPLHPWQAANSVPQRFAPLLARGDLVVLDEVPWTAAPTMSLRTMACGHGSEVPHVKLPLSLWLTSAERTVSPKSTVMGPRLTALLRAMLAREPAWRQKLDIADELVGLHVRHPEGNDDMARHLSVLYRRHPATLLADGEQVVPVGALFAPSPLSGRLLATEAVALGHADQPAGALAFYADYVDIALQAVLQPYLCYGIALEAHQQNSFVVLAADGQPVRLLVRDFGDVRVHAPTLASQGLRLQGYREGMTLYQDHAPVRDKVMHAFLLCHLVELARALAHAYGQQAGSYVAVLRQALERLFAGLRPRVAAQRWQAERDALLEQPWPAKSFLRMRLNNSSDDVVLRMPNPLREAV